MGELVLYLASIGIAGFGISFKKIVMQSLVLVLTLGPSFGGGRGY